MHTLNSIITQNYATNEVPYVSADIPQGFVQPWLRLLRLAIGQEKYDQYTENQQQRDHNTYHVTLINPMEYGAVQSLTAPFIGYPVHLITFGIGHVAEDDNEVYFLVCACPEMDKIRAFLKQPKANFHITLGFKTSDIFSKPKNKSTLIFPYDIVEV